MPTDELLTVDEAKALLRCSRWTLHRLAGDGEITAVKFGAARNAPKRYDAGSIRAYIARMRQQTRAQQDLQVVPRQRQSKRGAA